MAEHLYNQLLPSQPLTPKVSLSPRETIGFVALFISPLLTFYTLASAELGQDQRLFLATLSSTIVMWMFRLFPDFIGGIFLLLMTLMLGIVPTKTVLAGLSSETFILVMSVGALTVALMDSNLISRLLYQMLKLLPPHALFCHIVLFLTGFLLTPFIPSIISRIQLIAPFLGRIFYVFDMKSASNTSTFLSFTAFMGVTCFSSVFLSSSLVNFVILGFLPSQEQFQFQWLGWLKGSLAYGSVMLVGLGVLMVLFAAFSFKLTIPEGYLDKEIQKLGPFNRKEALVLGCSVLFSLGILTFSLHKISLAWISLSLLFILLGTGLLSKRDFETRLDWSFLLFLSSAIGITTCVNFLSLDTFLNNALTPYIASFLESSYRFYFFTCLITCLVRVVLPPPAAIVLLCSFLIPLASSYGYSSWVTSFVILVSSDIWFFSYQNFLYVAYAEDVASHTHPQPYREKVFLLLNAGLVLLKLMGLYVSLSYWHHLGLD